MLGRRLKNWLARVLSGPCRFVGAICKIEVIGNRAVPPYPAWTTCLWWWTWNAGLSIKAELVWKGFNAQKRPADWQWCSGAGVWFISYQDLGWSGHEDCIGAMKTPPPLLAKCLRAAREYLMIIAMNKAQNSVLKYLKGHLHLKFDSKNLKIFLLRNLYLQSIIIGSIIKGIVLGCFRDS